MARERLDVGRLDGAYRLVQVLLSPGPLREAMLRRSEPTEAAATLLATIRTIVVGDRELAAHELLDQGWDEAGIRAEVEGLFAAGAPPRDLP